MAPTLPDTGFPYPVIAWDWGVAGRDQRLARAISDVTTGGYIGSTRELLASVRGAGRFDRRAYCTSALAAVLVRRGLSLDEQWLAEEPRNPDALLLRARALTVRAIHASRAGSDETPALAELATRACYRAAEAAEPDPTPWVTLLNLAEADGPSGALPDVAPDGLAVSAPWALFAEVTSRDLYNIEAVQRLIPRCRAVGGQHPADEARAQVAVWAADSAPAGSPLKLLPLKHAPARDPFPDAAEAVRAGYDLAGRDKWSARAQYVYRAVRQEMLDERWSLAMRKAAVDLADLWFGEGRQPPYMPLSYLSFLTDFLVQQSERDAARAVLTWMIPHATTEPWRRRGDPGQVLTQVCMQCNLQPALIAR